MTHTTQVSRPYKDVPASQLADVLESQWGEQPLNEAVVAELLNRALEAEGELA